LFDKKNVEPQQIMPTYSGFLIDKLNKISEAWDEGDMELALRRAMRLVYFLPTDLKKVLLPKVSVIRKQMNHAYALHGSDFFTTQIIRNRAARQITLRELPPFIDQVVELLDQRGYLEKSSHYLKAEDFKEFGENK